jgi:hypothetical protein
VAVPNKLPLPSSTIPARRSAQVRESAGQDGVNQHRRFSHASPVCTGNNKLGPPARRPSAGAWAKSNLSDVYACLSQRNRRGRNSWRNSRRSDRCSICNLSDNRTGPARWSSPPDRAGGHRRAIIAGLRQSPEGNQPGQGQGALAGPTQEIPARDADGQPFRCFANSVKHQGPTFRKESQDHFRRIARLAAMESRLKQMAVGRAPAPSTRGPSATVIALAIDQNPAARAGVVLRPVDKAD